MWSGALGCEGSEGNGEDWDKGSCNNLVSGGIRGISEENKTCGESSVFCKAVGD